MTYDPKHPTVAAATQRELDRTADKAHAAVDRVTDTAHSTVDNVTDKAQQVAGEAKDKAQQVAGKAQDLGAQAVERADTATTTIGGKISDAAQTIRDSAPTSGPIANAAGTAADTLEQAGTYLQKRDLSDMRADLAGIIRRHPMGSLLVGLGVGYLLARSMRE